MRRVTATTSASPTPSFARATDFVDRRAVVVEAVIFAGDFNVIRAQSETTKRLESAPPEFRWTETGAQIDHVLLRGCVAASARVWSDAERSHAGRLLSDHPPIEFELILRGER